MDTYSEQLVKKSENSNDRMKKIGIVIGGSAAIFVLLYVTVFIMPIAVIAVCGGIYGVYWLLKCQNVEYEYTITNGSIDIDKIIARRKRVSMITVDVKEFTDFGLYHSENDNFDGTTVMALGEDSEACFADFYNERYGETRLIFSPNEKVMNCIKPYLPRNLKIKN